jgi:hypothetical protein
MVATTIENIQVPEKLPFLESICWQTSDVRHFTLEEMLSRYERGWTYLNLFGNLDGEERSFLRRLAQSYHSWLQADL